MATYSMKVSAAIATSGNVANGANTSIYTCPASSYAEVQLRLVWGGAFAGSAQVTVGGQAVMMFDDNTAANTTTFPVAQMLAGSLSHPNVFAFKVGPSQSIAINNGGGSSVNYELSGIVFSS